jgi:hypothetical protein
MFFFSKNKTKNKTGNGPEVYHNTDGNEIKTRKQLTAFIG